MKTIFYDIIKYPVQRFLQLLIILSVTTFVGCKGKSSTNESEKLKESVSTQYDDGLYCADVTYYNPRSQRTSRYTLNVQVEEGKLTKILWSNGGWLDDTHFTPPEVPKSGYCSFTSDRGYEYTVDIRGTVCTYTDNPTAIEGKEGAISRRECAEMYGASTELLNAYLKKSQLSADDIIDDESCDMMHKGLATFERLWNLERKIDKGYIQSVVTKSREDYITCQVIIVKRKGILYLLEITGGEATMGLTSFDPNNEDWQEIMIQKDPNVDHWTVVQARVLTTGSMSELENLARSFCR